MNASLEHVNVAYLLKIISVFVVVGKRGGDKTDTILFRIKVVKLKIIFQSHIQKKNSQNFNL